MGVAERYKQKKEEEKRSGQKSAQGGVAYRYKQKRAGEVSKQIAERANAWTAKSNTYLDSYKSRFSSRSGTYKDSYVSDADSWLERLQNDSAALREEQSAITALMNEYRDFLDNDWMQSINDAFSGGNQAHQQAISYAQKDRDYWSQWADEAAYTKYQTDMAEHDRIVNYDVEGAQKQADALKAKISEAEELRKLVNIWDSAGQAVSTPEVENARNRLRAIQDEFGGIDGLRQQYSGLVTDMNRAKRQKEGITLTNEALESAEFSDLSKKQDNISSAKYRYINDPEYRSEYQAALRMSSVDNPNGAYDPFSESGLDLMDDTEKAIYNYYYAKDGEAAADKYLGTIQEQLNHRKATGIFKGLEDNTLLEMAFGVSAGIDQWQSGMGTAVNALLGSEGEYRPATYKQMASGMVREDLADTGFKLPDILGGASIAQAGYDAITTSANMFPSIVGATLSNIVAPGSGVVVGGVMMGGSAGGNAYQEMINLGYDQDQAKAYGLLTGASEVALQSILGGISQLGGKVSGNVISKLTSNIDNAVGRVALKLGGNMLSEGMEESLQEILTPWFHSILTGEEFSVNTADVLYSGLLGALTAGVFEGGGTVSEGVNTYKTGKDILSVKDAPQRIAALGRTFSADTVAYQLANRVDENTGAYTMGRLFNEIGATLTEQNVADIRTDLESRGIAGKDARILSEAIAAVVEGTELTERQIKALEANDALSSSVIDTLIKPNSTVFQRTMGYDQLLASAEDTTGDNTADTPQQAQREQSQGDIMNGETAGVSEESGVQGEWAAPAEGKTIRKDTGEVTQIKEIASIRDGAVTLRLEDGSQIKAKDLSFGSRGEALVYETVAGMTNDVESANLLVKEFYRIHTQSPAQAQAYVAGIQEAYRFGSINIPMKELLDSDFASGINAAYRDYAYRMGQHNAGQQIAKKQATATQSGALTEKKAGKVHFDRKGRTLDNIREASLKTMEQLSAALGVEIYVYESYENKARQRVYKDAEGREMPAPNGYYDPKTGAVHIDLNAGQDGKGTMLFTVAHELTHFIRDWSPAKFRVLANFLIKQYGEQGVSVNQLVQAQIDKAKRNGRTLSWDEAYEEMVADSMETMLTDGNVVQVMADLKEQDRSLWQKICDWFKNLAADLQKVVDAYRGVKAATVEGRMVADMQDVIVYLQGLYEDALADASENFQRAEKNTVPEGGVKYSLKKYTDHQKKNWATSKRIVVYSNVEQLAKFIQESIANKSMDKKMYFGAIPADLAAMIETETGLDVENYNLSLGSYEIRKILKDHGVESKEAPRGQRAVVEDDFAHIVDVVLNPTNISLSEDQYMGKPAIIFTGSHNGRMNVVAVVSDKRLDLFVQTIYVNVKKEGNLATPTGDQAPANTPEANNGTVSSDSSIRNPGEEVNKKFSARDSEGKKLSQEQQEYFKDSKIRDSSGHLMPMYHGTLHGGFTVFGGRKDYWYFTKDRKYSYTFEGKKQNGHLYPSVKEGIEAGYYTPQRYKVYLNVTNPYVTDDVNIVEDALYWDRNLASKLREKGYDALILEDMSQVIVLNANQIKNVTNRKPTSNPDIHYSDRDPAAGRVNKVLQKENAQLKEDVRYLKELLKLQHTVTGGTKFTKSSLENMAGILMKANNVKGNRAELAGLLNGLYEYIAKGEELTWEGVTEMAQPAVEWLRRNTVIQGSMSEYAQNILRDIRTSRISLDDAQVEEAAYRYGSFNDYRKSMMGSVVIAKDGVPLDTKWQEWASMYPDVFDPDTVATDMPGALADAISSLRNSDMSRAEYAYHADMIAQDLLQQVYDGYWRVSTLRTVADVKQKEINILKSKHYQRMNDLRQTHRENTEKLKQEHRAEMKRIREKYREASDRQRKEIMDRYDESRKKAVESRNRTAMRHKIQNVVKELNNYLLKGTKERHVPEELKKVVAEALDAVNMDTVGAEERIAKLRAELMKAKTPEKMEEISRKIENVRKMGDNMHDRLRKLKDAYDQLLESDDPIYANAHDEVISTKLDAVLKSVGDTALRDMSMRQLEDVYDMYRVVLETIRNANKTFKQAKTATITELSAKVMQEVKMVGGEHKYKLSGTGGASEFLWNAMKPVYAFEHIGSDTLTKLFDSVRSGEDVWATDVSEARAFFVDKNKAYGYDSWDMEKQYSFTSSSGMDFKLNLEQIMSLYAYSKRDQAADHLRKGGIVFDPGTEVVEQTKYGIKVKYDVTEATAYNIAPDTLAEIIGKLNADQKAFVDDMQEYLSATMGGKGNEVSMALYGIRLFKEKHYFPLKSAPQYMAKAKEQAQGDVKIKNSGFSKETVTKASNPIVLSGFMDVWSGHVNEMSMYHAFVLPMEDFYRVYNYKSPTTETGETVSVNSRIQNAYGKGATGYIDQLLKDLNGGARVDTTTGFVNKMIGKFKKGAVFASFSVVVQQPSAIARAAALVDTKYFIGPKIDKQRHKLLWEEVKKYAPVALIKEMGYFDTNMGKSTKDFITGKEYTGFTEKMKALVQDSNYRDEVLSKLPALADEWAWSGIWEAVKRETAAKYSKMDTKSDAFLKLVGERFTEVIVKTQVYDSVLSRSAMMRSKDTGMKMATAFMAEPTTSINMVADALLKGKRGNVKYCRTAIGAVIASQILNSILVSFVYAARDDDEEKSYEEKYITSFTEKSIESLNPAAYIPFIKDIVSICRGYAVERSDMAIISDLYDGFKALSSPNKTPYEKVEKFAGSVAQLFGLPLKNIMRDARGIYQTIISFVTGEKTTRAGVGYAVKSGLPGWLGGGDTSKQEQLYQALVRGDDQEQIQRTAGRYEDQKAAETAMRAAIKEHYKDGDISADTAKKHLVDFCSMSEDDAYWKLQEWEYENDSEDDFRKYDDFLDAVKTGKNLKAVIKRYTDNGVELKTLREQITSYYKPLYMEMSRTEKANIKGYLLNAMEQCGDSREDAMKKIANWEYEAQYPEVAERISYTQFQKWESAGKPYGVSVEMFIKVSEYRNDDGQGNSRDQDEVAEFINSLDISQKQKDALWCCFWKSSTLKDAPWH